MQQNSIVILRNDRLFVYKKVDSDYQASEFSLHDINKLEKGYILILPDSLVNLIYTDLRPVKDKKLKEMVRVYLKGLYPDEVMEDTDFGYVNTSPVIAYLITDKLKSLINSSSLLFEKAMITTTPSLLALHSETGAFLFSTDETLLVKKDDDFIHVIGKIEGLDTSEIAHQITVKNDDHRGLIELFKGLLWVETPRSVDLNLLRSKKSVFKAETLKGEIILFSILYVIFLSALILNLAPIKKERKAYERKISDIYKELRIQNTADPYGMLIFKLDKLKTEHLQYPDPLKILSGISLSFNNNSRIESITANKELIRIKGTIKTLEGLEKAMERLSKELGLKFTTESAKVKDNLVNFVIVGRSKK